MGGCIMELCRSYRQTAFFFVVSFGHTICIADSYHVFLAYDSLRWPFVLSLVQFVLKNSVDVHGFFGMKNLLSIDEPIRYENLAGGISMDLQF